MCLTQSITRRYQIEMKLTKSAIKGAIILPTLPNVEQIPVVSDLQYVGNSSVEYT